MITLKCSRCMREIVVGDAVRGMEIPCARCGEKLTAVLPPDAGATELRLPAITPQPVESSEVATKDQADDDNETMTPLQAERAESFPFLAPPGETGDLGQLAHYRIVKLLGQGGMGIVFEAVDTHLERTVALKVMKPELAQDESSRQRFLREARAMASVKSDHVATIHQVALHNGLPFLAMEFLQGESLEVWLQRKKQASLEETLRIGIEIARGLLAAHGKGLIHRDIKPGNIWLEAPNDRVKILDFGLARINQDRKNLTNVGLVMGTPAYMAPEQVEKRKVDARCDLFSLGCVLYELATGKQAFTGPSSMAILMAVANKDPVPPQSLNPAVPAPLTSLIMRMLEKDPEKRPDNARAVLDALEAIAVERGISTITPASGSTHIRADSAPQTPPRGIVITPSTLVGLLIGVPAAFFALLIVSILAWHYFLPPQPANIPVQPAGMRGVTDTTILVGMTAPLTGPMRELGREMKTGINTYFSHINAQGGIEGRKLDLITLDDGYDPDRALANMHALYEDHQVFAVIGNVGGPGAAKTLPYAVEKKMLIFDGFTPRQLRQDPPDHYIFNYRANLDEETRAIVDHLIGARKLQPAQLAVFAQADIYGDDTYHGVVKALHAAGHAASDILRVSYDRKTLKVDEAAAVIAKRADIRAVIMASTYKPAAAFIHAVKEARPEMLFASVSFVGSEPLAEALVEWGPRFAEGVIVTQVVPPVDAGSTLVLKYRDLLKTYNRGERPSFTSLEGYIAAAVFTEGLKRAGKKLTTESLIDGLESIRALDLGIGAPISFGPSEHQASHRVWGTVLDGDGRFWNLDLKE